MAQRELGLAIGEPPSSRGYPPSIFSLLPKLLERTGISSNGSITAFYTVLVEGDDFNEPITDAVRGVLDGHIVLTRELADKGHYPAIDILGSVSRVMPKITPDEHRRAAKRIRELIAEYRRSEDLVTIGAYKQGTNAELDIAIKLRSEINDFLQQDAARGVPYDTTLERLYELASAAANAGGEA
jgi:flagellum-specific ATP synthase